MANYVCAVCGYTPEEVGKITLGEAAAIIEIHKEMASGKSGGSSLSRSNKSRLHAKAKAKGYGI